MSSVYDTADERRIKKVTAGQYRSRSWIRWDTPYGAAVGRIHNLGRSASGRDRREGCRSLPEKTKSSHKKDRNGRALPSHLSGLSVNIAEPMAIKRQFLLSITHSILLLGCERKQMTVVQRREAADVAKSERTLSKPLKVC